MSLDSYKNNSNRIKAEAKRLGFSDCGITKACFLDKDASYLKQWIDKGYHADMNYMSENSEKRKDPELLVKNTKSIVSVLLNYYPQYSQPDGFPRISKYAYGKDYHVVLKKKLDILLQFIQNNIAKAEGRVFVDSAPVFEKAWAQRAGLGWQGKNTCLITKEFGSWVFIGEILLDMDLAYDEPMKNYCGSCAACIDSCPTNAIVSEKTIDSNKCISYQTIENKTEIPEHLKGKMNNYIFGCDICQNVCPWNQKPVITGEDDFLSINPILKMTVDEIKQTEEVQLKKLLKGTAMERTKTKGLRRNIKFISE